jgi:hypothetical protein
MGNIFLHAFISKVRDSRRLLYGDLQRLQRNVLPDGPTTREEAETLIALHDVLERVDDGWPGYLAGALKAFALSSSKPRGSIDRERAKWLVSALAALPSKMAVTIAREIVQEAQHADAELLAFAGKGAKGKSRTVACRRTPDPCVSYWPGQDYEWGSISVSFAESVGIEERRSSEPRPDTKEIRASIPASARIAGRVV